MLINWQKSVQSAKLTDNFLHNLFLRMRPDVWFASATSVTHYLGTLPSSKPFMRQILNAGRLPTVGVLGKWSVDEAGKSTSQFAAIFRSTKSLSKSLIELGNDLDRQSLNSLQDIGLNSRWNEQMTEDELADAMEVGDIFSFREIERGKYKVRRLLWSDLSNHCAKRHIIYEM